MEKWQYISLAASNSVVGEGTYFYNGQTATKIGNLDENHIIQYLNQLGQDGWELVSATHEVNRLGVSNRYWILKRPIP